MREYRRLRDLASRLRCNGPPHLGNLVSGSLQAYKCEKMAIAPASRTMQVPTWLRLPPETAHAEKLGNGANGNSRGLTVAAQRERDLFGQMAAYPLWPASLQTTRWMRRPSTAGCRNTTVFVASNRPQRG